jgi:hypothetical protein
MSLGEALETSDQPNQPKPPLREEFKQPFLGEKEQALAQQAFKAATDPLQEQFQERLTTNVEDLSRKGIAFGGVGSEAVGDLFEEQAELEAGIASDIATQIGGTALEQAFLANESAKQIQAQRESQLLSQQFQSGEAKLGREFTAQEAELNRQFQSGEARLGREFTTSEREAIERFTQSQASQERQFAAEQANLGREFTAEENERLRAFQDEQRQFAESFSSEEREAIQDYQLAFQEAGFEQQVSLLEMEEASRVNDQKLQLFLSGNLSGEEAEAAIQDILGEGMVLTNEDELRLQRAASASGLSVEDYTAVRSVLGTAQAELILSNPEEFIADPERAREFQLQLAREANEAAVDVAEAESEGKVLCTELHRQGLLPTEIFEADIKHSYKVNRTVVKGYHHWAKPLVVKMKYNPVLTSIVKPFVRAWAYQMAYKEGVVSKPNLFGFTLELIGMPMCYLLGKYLECKNKVEVVNNG